MYQILFHLPIKSWFGVFSDIPIHGYGFMLFLAFVFCTLLAVYLARKQRIAAENIHDLALWLFVSGIIGARLVYVVQYRGQFASNPMAIFSIWDGGLVFYGSALGGAVGFIGYYKMVMKPKKIRFWQMADIVAPCIALGLCLGRIGCLLNGCCYGGPACESCPAISFPLPTEPRYEMVRLGFQSPAGFLFGMNPLQPLLVNKVEPDSSAAHAGLEEGDEVIEAEGQKIENYNELAKIFQNWQGERRGVNVLNLKVRRGNEEVSLSFIPWTIGLHPTQIYESISTGLLLFLLLSYYPLRRHDGEVFVLLILGYSVHRFLNEAIRIDTHWDYLGLSLSQHLSILIFVTGIVLGIWLWRQPPQFGPQTPPPEQIAAAATLPKPAPETGIALLD